MSFPNIDSWQSKMFKGKWLHLDPPRHLFFFAPLDFVEMMKKRGFLLESKKFFSPEQNPYGMIQSTLNLFTKKREVLFENLKGNTAYAPEYGKINIIFQKLFFLGAMPFFMVADVFATIAGKSATVEFTFRKK
jgi:hypothetical protein